MGLQQFERRLERLVEGVFAKAFRSGLQPVEIGRRLTREMDVHRTLAPRGTLAPNAFTVVLSVADRDRFAPIEEELVSELIAVARDHAEDEGYVFLGPISVTVDEDPGLARGRLLLTGEMARTSGPSAALVLADGRRVDLAQTQVTLGRLPECQVPLADPNVSRRHAEIRPAEHGAGWELADLGSTNGTKLNGLRIGAPTPLRSGDQITVGATTVIFEGA